MLPASSRFVQLMAIFFILATVKQVKALSSHILWADRGDRFEGVITTRKISGGIFALQGFQRLVDDELNPAASMMYVSFWLPEKSSPSVKVWEPMTNYWMVPKKKTFPSGTGSFSWPVDRVLRPMHMDLTKLKVLVTDAAETIYFPAVLTTGADMKPTDRYLFSFESKGGVELQGAILREAGNAWVPVKKFQRIEDYPGVMNFIWDGLDLHGQPVPAGYLRLRLEGWVFLTESDEELALDIRFFHPVHP